MKKLIIALSLAISFGAAAMPEIRATPSGDGSWIEVTQNGVPVPFAIVNDQFETDDNGRVFIYNPSEFPSNVKYRAITPEGDEISTQAFLPRRN